MPGNAAAEAFFSSLEWEVLSRNRFRDTVQAQAVVIDWCYTFYNHQRRHSAADGLSPVNYEIRESKTKPEAALETLHDFGGKTALTFDTI